MIAFVVLAFAAWRYRHVLLRGVPEMSPQALGLFRVVFGAAVLWVFVRYEPLQADEPRDYEWWGSWQWIDDLATSGGALQLVETVTVIAFGLFAIGLFTRVAYAVGAAGFVLGVLVHVESGSQHDWGLPMFAVLVGLFVRWGDGFSLDEAIRRLRGKASPAPKIGSRYGLGVWLPGMVTGLALAAAAYAKVAINGFTFDWATGGAVQYHWVEDADNAPLDVGLWIASHETLAVFMSANALVVEGLFFTHVFFRSSLVRGAYGLVLFALLGGFFLFQGVFWFPWWLVLLAFLPWQQIWTTASSLLPASVVLADERCPMCRRTARILHALDFFDRLSFADAGDDDVRGRWAPGVSRDQALAAMYAVDCETGEVRGGLDAYLLLGRSLPLLWPAVVVGSLPGIRQAGEAVYRRVAASRTRDEPCTDESCEISAAGRKLRALPASPWGRPALHAALGPGIAVLVAFLVVGQGLVSRLRIEREPFVSNFPMYANTHESRDAYDAIARTLLRRPRFELAGGRPPLGQDEERDPGVGALVDAAENAVLHAGSESLLLPADPPLARMRDEYERVHGTAPGPISVFGSFKRFDWEAGAFEEPEEVLAATIVKDLILVKPLTGKIDVVAWPEGTAGFTVSLGSFRSKDEAVAAGRELARMGIPQVGILNAAEHGLGPRGATLLFAGVFGSAGEADPIRTILQELGHDDAEIVEVRG